MGKIRNTAPEKRVVGEKGAGTNGKRGSGLFISKEVKLSNSRREVSLGRAWFGKQQAGALRLGTSGKGESIWGGGGVGGGGGAGVQGVQNHRRDSKTKYYPNGGVSQKGELRNRMEAIKMQTNVIISRQGK